MVPIQEFLPYVLPYAHGCSDPLAEQFIRDVCIDFCVGAPLVQITLDPIDVEAGEAQYDVDLPSSMDTALILAATYGSVPLDVEKTGDNPFTGTNIATGTPTSLVLSPGNTFALNRLPQFDLAGGIQMLVSTKPTRSATSVADVLMEYAYEIGQGVVGRLLLIPGQEFTSPQTAGLYTATYNTAKFAARIRAERSFGIASTRVKPRPFA